MLPNQLIRRLASGGSQRSEGGRTRPPLLDFEMCAKMPLCPYRVQDCPGSSDDAYEFFDEQIWELFQWMCWRCQGDFRIANNLPFDDDECLAA